MENDLISRSALLEEFNGIYDRHFKNSAYQFIHDFFKAARRRINKAPAVDAVEVVRCVECANNKTCHRVVVIMPREEDYGVMCGRLHYCEYGVRRVDDGE